MKKILYNNYTKFIAFILCALSVAIASYLVTTNYAYFLDSIKNSVDKNAMIVLTFLSVAAIMFVYLLCVTGKEYGTDEIHTMLVDKMFVEITAALFFGILFGLGALTILGVGYLIGKGVMIVNALSAVAIFAIVSLSLLLFLSLVRNLKNGTFIQRSMTVRFVRFACKYFKRLCKFVWNTFVKICKSIICGLRRAKKTVLTMTAKNFDGKFVGIAIIPYSVVIAALFSCGLESSPVCMMLFVLLIAAAVWFITKRLIGFYNLKNGIEKIQDGDLSYKITDCPDGVIGVMAENINSIGDGLQKSLANEVKAERMKSELITNVSHDLKTPLTSIINYADLLSKETLMPSEANDYVKIIQQKSARLNQLTNDLFDISKAQSGNEEFNIEDIDIGLLINQTMAELNEQIEKSELTFKFTAAENEIFIKGDGKKLSRVFENLFINCVKYSMKNTRVYIDIAEHDREVSVEIKNIAGYEMDFDENEIAERFVRGDSARNSEGNGLGLAIVKSYVEGCGGSVKITVDGDLFKVAIRLKK